MSRKRLFFLLFFVVLFVLGKAIFSFYPQDVKKSYDQVVVTQDGVSIVFDVFAPKEVQGKPLIPIILGHGIMVNKGVMRLLALELANAGFLAVALDFRGHGRSQGELTEVAKGVDWRQIHRHKLDHTSCFAPLTKDIAAIKKYLQQRGDADLHNLGYVGYSMGGGAGFADCFLHRDFKAMVGVAPAPDSYRTKPDNPPNLLIVAAKYDEVLQLAWYFQTMEKKTNIAAREIETGRTYGSFSDGTAARLYVDDYCDHLLAPWDFDFVRETRDWLVQAFSPRVAAGQPFSYFPQLVAVALQAIGILGAFLLLAGAAAKRFGRRVEKEIFPADIIVARPLSYFMTRFFLFTAMFSLPCMLFGLPLLLTPHPFGFLQLLLALGPGIAILLCVKFSLKISPLTRWYWRILCITNLRNATTGILLGILFYLAMANSLGNLFGMVPSSSKGIWALFFCLLSLISLLPFTLFFQGILQRKLCLSGSRHSLAASVIFQYVSWVGVMAFVVFFPCLFSSHAYFLLMSWIAMLLPLFLFSWISVILYADTQDPILATLPQAIFIGIICCTISPPIMR